VHSAIGRSQPREIDFMLLLDLARKRTAGELGETFFAPRDGSPDSYIKTIGNFQRDCFHSNTRCITAVALLMRTGNPVTAAHNFSARWPKGLTIFSSRMTWPSWKSSE
jgi:hypothetical protein